MQISGGLENHAHLRVLTALCRPHFNTRVHDPQVGNNLIKAYVDLKDTGPVRVILEQLYASQRPDWREHLLYWEQQIDAAAGRFGPVKIPPPLEVGLLTKEVVSSCPRNPGGSKI